MESSTHGIVSTDDGSFCMVSLERAAAGWRTKKTSRWNADSAVRNHLLLNRGVIAAVPSRWRPSDAKTGPSSLSGTFIAAEESGDFVPMADETALSSISTRLADNLCATVCDDAYLCTIPLALTDGSIASFVSARRTGESCKIGIVKDRRLMAVFSVAPASQPESLERHLARISRYWNGKFGDRTSFPNHLFLFGNDVVSPNGTINVTRLDCSILGIECTDTFALGAAGAALVGITGDVPRFPGNPGKAAFRKVRAALYATSVSLVACTILLSATLFVSSFVMHARQDDYKQEYEKILACTPDIQALMAHNDSLAAAIMTENTAGSHVPRWTPFLRSLGSDRPDGLFLDMLATDASGVAGTVRVALSGWAYNESLVTGFIALLQKNGVCYDVTLSSLEKSGEHNVFIFRILCSLRLFAGSPAK